ncbi:MAG: CpsD/CapB family tyrosine-protein kinase [Blastocatellia bacterium]
MGNVYAASVRQTEAGVTQTQPLNQAATNEITFDFVPQTQALEPFDLRLFTSPQPAAGSDETQSSTALARVRTTSPLSRRLLLQPDLEVLPDPERMDAHLAAALEGDRRVEEQYGRLAVSMIAAAEARQHRRILTISAQSGEGRTCVTLNLAAALARARRRVLVIDGDLNRPSTLRLLGISSKAGLAEVLAQRCPLETALIRVLPFGFHLLPSRERIENPAELFGDAALSRLLDEADAMYDFILIDAPPLGGAETQWLARLADTALLVVSPQRSSARQVLKSLAAFPGEEIAGVLINGLME